MESLTGSQAVYATSLPTPQYHGNYTVVDAHELMRNAGAERCEVSDRNVFLWGPNKTNVTHYRVDVARFREEITEIFQSQSAFMEHSHRLIRPAIVWVLRQDVSQRALCIDLDWQQDARYAHPIQLDWPLYAEVTHNVWSIIREHAETELPEYTRVYMSGSSSQEKPVSLHLFYPDFQTYQRFPDALIDALNDYLGSFYLSCDAKISGLKTCNSDKPGPFGSYRGHSMEPVYYSEPGVNCSQIYWSEWANVSCPLAIDADQRTTVEFRDQRAQLTTAMRGAGPSVSMDPALMPDDLKEVWQYYLKQYAPDAQIAKLQQTGDAWFIGTKETHNLVCPHRGNNHWIRYNRGAIKIGCNGTANSKIYELTLMQVRQYMRTVQQAEQPMELDEEDFVMQFATFLQETPSCDVTTPIIKHQFEALGQPCPPYALTDQYMGNGSLISGRLFEQLKQLGDDSVLVRYVNLGVGFATGTGLYVMRLPTGKVKVGVKDATVKHVLANCRVVPDGEKKLKSFYDTWRHSVERSEAATVSYAMQRSPNVSYAYNIRMVPAITPPLARARLAALRPDQQQAAMTAVKAWWDILLKAMCCGVTANKTVFYEWIELWCAETIFGSKLIGLYLQIYEPKGGVGKSRLGEALMSILGSDMCAIVKNIGEFLSDRWATARIGRRLMFADDAKLPSKMLSQFNSLITSQQFSVEFKGGQQGVNFPNHLSSLILTNELKKSGGTERERRMCLTVAGPYYGPDCPEYTAANRALFGDTLDSFLAWGFDHMTTLDGSKPSQYLYALVLHLEQVYQAKGTSKEVIEWLRLRVQNGDMRTVEKDSLAEGIYGEVGDWIIARLSADGPGHLYHKSQEWNPNTLNGDRTVAVLDNWPDQTTCLSADMVNTVPATHPTATDLYGRYRSIPSSTLFKAFRMAGYRTLTDRNFATQFIKAFNGLSQLWDRTRSTHTFATSQRATGSIGVAANNEGQYIVGFGQGERKQMRVITLDYGAVDLYVSRQMDLPEQH